MTTASASIAPATRRTAGLALILGLLGIPGSTIAWDLPAGGFWIGMPLAFAALIIGVRSLAHPDRRWMAIAAIVLASAEILFTATWTVLG